MAFNSTEFVGFFLLVYFVYWALARRRTASFAWLVLASCVFYAGWNVKFLGLILASAALDWTCGGAIHRSESPRVRRAWLAASLAGNLGLLGYFKYFNFFAENVASGLAAAGFEGASTFVPWDIVLPAGISFYTFQTLSYTIDIYRRQLAPARSPLDFFLFVGFFPQLVAGPIVRAADFLPQLDGPARHDEERVARGLYRIVTGLAKKVLLADVIGKHLVDPVFADPSAHGAQGIALGCSGALFQFYLDFSAYSDIAIGAAACLGFELCENFERPVLAQSISDPLHVVPRLRLPVLRGARRASPRVPAQPDGHDAAHGPLAWSGLELRDLGPDARRVHLCRCGVRCVSEARGAGSTSALEPRGAACRRVHIGRFQHAVLPQRHARGRQSRRRGLARDASHALLAVSCVWGAAAARVGARRVARRRAHPLHAARMAA